MGARRILLPAGIAAVRFANARRACFLASSESPSCCSNPRKRAQSPLPVLPHAFVKDLHPRESHSLRCGVPPEFRLLQHHMSDMVAIYALPIAT